MTPPTISLLRKSLRSNAPSQFTNNWNRNSNQDQDAYKSKPSINESTVSSLTYSVTNNATVFNGNSSSPGAEIDIVKRRISQDITLDTVSDSIDMASSLGSSSANNGTQVRRLNSIENEDCTSIHRMSSIQDKILKDKDKNSKLGKGERGEIDSSVSSLTLGSDLKLNGKVKANSFGETETQSLRSASSISRNRSMNNISMSNRSMSGSRSGSSATDSEGGSHRGDHSLTLTELQRSLEKINEELSSRGSTANSCVSTKEEPSLTLTDLQSTSLLSSKMSKGSGGTEIVLSDDENVQSGYERQRKRFFDRTKRRNQRSSSSEASGSNVESSIHTIKNRVHHLQHLLSQGEQSTSSTESTFTPETLDLISSLHETNLLNESAILKLQHELSVMTNERDAFRMNSDRMMQVMTSQNTELQTQLKNERKGFARMSKVHKKELNEWMNKASLLSTKVLDLEQQAKARELEDEARGEKIANLESNMARLVEVYSTNNSCKDADNECHGKEVNEPNPSSDFTAATDSFSVEGTEVEESLHASDAQSLSQLEQHSSHYEMMDFEVKCWKENYDRLKKCYDDLVEKNKRQCEELQSEVKRCKTTIENLEEVNLRSGRISGDTSDSTYNDELLNKICQLVDENTSLVERCCELEDALEKCMHDSQQELETSKAMFESSIRNLKQDLESAKEKNATTLHLIDALRLENTKLLASSTEQGEKKVRFVDQLRSSITSTASIVSNGCVDEMDEPRISEEYEEILARIADMEEENTILRKSMKQAMSLASDMNKRMISFVESHEASVVNYQEQLESIRNQLTREKTINETLKSEKTELCKELKLLKQGLSQDNSKLNVSVKEAGISGATGEGERSSENTAIADDEALVIERNALEYLREEVKKSCCEIKTLKQNNETLSLELKEKNEAMKLVKAALNSLKAEQQSIKETVVALRQENVRLRDENEDNGNAPNASSEGKSILGSDQLSATSSKERAGFETRLVKIERENRGLREANASLSMKLFDEMEKTDALQVANEGLAARICKLVTFIRQSGPSNDRNSSSIAYHN